MPRKPNPLKKETGGRSSLTQLALELGVVFADAGLPEIAGRILGWLLVCDPAEQSLEELRLAARASKASISNMTRMLQHLGFIERGRGGQSRVFFYRLREDPWTAFSEKRLETTRRLVALGRRAVESLHWMSSERRRRIELMSRFWSFLLNRNQGFIEEWKQVTTRQKTEGRASVRKSSGNEA